VIRGERSRYIHWKLLQSRWTVELQTEVCYSEHYVGDTAQQVDSGIVV